MCASILHTLYTLYIYICIYIITLSAFKWLRGAYDSNQPIVDAPPGNFDGARIEMFISYVTETLGYLLADIGRHPDASLNTS